VKTEHTNLPARIPTQEYQDMNLPAHIIMSSPPSMNLPANDTTFPDRSFKSQHDNENKKSSWLQHYRLALPKRRKGTILHRPPGGKSSSLGARL